MTHLMERSMMTTNNGEPLKICSLNSHGLKGYIMYIKHLLDNYIILFLNEHWITDREKFVIEK